MTSTFSLQNGVVFPAIVSLVPSDLSNPYGDTQFILILAPGVGVNENALL